MKFDYTAVGLMSGTSGDGLDLAVCGFTDWGEKWAYQIQKATTLPYPEAWQQKLSMAHELSGHDLALLDLEFGKYCGCQVLDFLADVDEKPLLIASHGHTIFHQPDLGLTKQIGHGAAMAAVAGLPVVSDFRVADVALGGQGAPLVPVGDQLLFGEFSFCLNLGGIANLSTRQDGAVLAYDVCACNMALNALAQRLDQDYDAFGALAASGRCLPELLQTLDDHAFFAQPAPKSLGREWVMGSWMEALRQSDAPVPDLLHTVCEHIAGQLGNAVRSFDAPKHSRVLVTGGGAFNRWLMQRIRLQTPEVDWVVADDQLVAFKEALIFALLGLLRWLERPNVLASATGSAKDHSAGMVALP